MTKSVNRGMTSIPADLVVEQVILLKWCGRTVLSLGLVKERLHRMECNASMWWAATS